MKLKKYLSLLLALVLVASCIVLTSVFMTEDAVWNREDYYKQSMTAHSEVDVSDQNHVTDEELFGAFDGSKWTQEPLFNYAKYPAMAAVETAAKAGDYESVKKSYLSIIKPNLTSSVWEQLAVVLWMSAIVLRQRLVLTICSLLNSAMML